MSANVDSPYYFRIVADYIHLNPARAGLAGGRRGKLVAWEWSSLPAYQRGRGPDWLVRSRVLSAFELAKDGRGRRAYVEWLERRARNEEGGFFRDFRGTGGSFWERLHRKLPGWTHFPRTMPGFWASTTPGESMLLTFGLMSGE